MSHLNSTICLAFATMVGMACSGGLKLSSRWAEPKVVIDGKHEEWQERMTFIEKKNVSIGFFNDENYLYVGLKTTDRAIKRQFMANGFSLWLDPDGGKSKKFGIRFPIGMMEMGLMTRGPGRKENIESMLENFDKSLVDLEITLPAEDEPQLMRVSEARGLQVKVGDMYDELFYEIRIPLRKNEAHPYAIQAANNKPIGVGFETAKFDFKKLKEEMRGGRGGGFGGGKRGGFGGGRGGPGGPGGGFAGGRPQMPKQFKLWTKVKLGFENQATSSVRSGPEFSLQKS